jgi:lysozyme
MKKAKTVHIIFILQSILCIVLSILLVVTVTSFERYKKSNAVPVDAQPQTDTSSNDVITKEALKNYAQQFGVSVEFLQRFFDDVIVYWDANQIVYAPIDENLPKHSYDFENNLVNLETEIQYHNNGVPAGIKGIDVSKYQGKIDWKKVKEDNVDFAMIRVGYRGYQNGKIVIDEYCKKNIEGALANGIKVGVYFFSQAISIEEVLEEAEMVLDMIKDYDITYPVVYDAEEIQGENVRTAKLTTQERTDITIAFCEKIKEAGYKPMIYANVSWFVGRLDLSRLVMYDKWFAQYFRTPFFPYDFQIWQYTAKGKIKGIEGNVDLNISFKDYSK